MDADLARGRALSSPLRWRILRVCLHAPRTNQEIAQRLGLRPATCLHHVRMLVETGFLAAQEPRRGKRNAVEIPYLATRLTWRTPTEASLLPTMLGAFTAEVAEVDPQQVLVGRLGVRLDADHLAAFKARLAELMQEFADLPTDPEGEAWSLFIAAHPDPQSG